MEIRKHLVNLQYLVFLLLGLVLLYFAFKGQDVSAIWAEVVSADFRWIALALAVTFLNHVVRAERWRMLMRPLGLRPSFGWTFLALMSGYFVNNVIPRLGEITRCGILHRRYKASFSGLLGSVVTERAIDVIMLFLMLCLILVVQFEKVSGFFVEQIVWPIWKNLADRQETFITLFFVLAGLLFIACLIIAYYRRQLMGTLLFRKASVHGRHFVDGLMTIRHLESPVLFLVYTLAIWVMYYLMTWLCFFALPATAGLGMVVGLVIIGIGSVGRTVPVQAGGMGAYHWILTQGLLLYGIAAKDGLALATIIHGYQTLFYLIVGAVCLLIVSLLQKRVVQA